MNVYPLADLKYYHFEIGLIIFSYVIHLYNLVFDLTVIQNHVCVYSVDAIEGEDPEKSQEDPEITTTGVELNNDNKNFILL